MGTVSFPHPPRVTGDARTDVAALIDWLWQFYKAAVPEGGFIAAGAPITLASYLLADLPDATDTPYALILVVDESGGAVPAFSDGANWRRVTDRAVVS